MFLLRLRLLLHLWLLLRLLHPLRLFHLPEFFWLCSCSCPCSCLVTGLHDHAPLPSETCAVLMCLCAFLRGQCDCTTVIFVRSHQRCPRLRAFIRACGHRHLRTWARGHMAQTGAEQSLSHTVGVTSDALDSGAFQKNALQNNPSREELRVGACITADNEPRPYCATKRGVAVNDKLISARQAAHIGVRWLTAVHLAQNSTSIITATSVCSNEVCTYKTV